LMIDREREKRRREKERKKEKYVKLFYYTMVTWYMRLTVLFICLSCRLVL
jgi:hypothetical protein